MLNASYQPCVPAPGIFVHKSKAFHQTGPHRIEMDIANQLLKVSIFIANDRFIAILKKMTVPVMAQVEVDGICGQKEPHIFG